MFDSRSNVRSNVQVQKQMLYDMVCNVDMNLVRQYRQMKVKVVFLTSRFFYCPFAAECLFWKEYTALIRPIGRFALSVLLTIERLCTCAWTCA